MMETTDRSASGKPWNKGTIVGQKSDALDQETNGALKAGHATARLEWQIKRGPASILVMQIGGCDRSAEVSAMRAPAAAAPASSALVACLSI